MPRWRSSVTTGAAAIRGCTQEFGEDSVFKRMGPGAMLPEYTISLLIFVVPAVALSVFFYKKNVMSSSQWRTLLVNVFTWAAVGFALDLVFARSFFVFPEP